MLRLFETYLSSFLKQLLNVMETVLKRVETCFEHVLMSELHVGTLLLTLVEICLKVFAILLVDTDRL